jgi:hypothetical protein
MSITELITKAGEANVRVQNIASDLVEMKRGKRGATIKVATSDEMASAVSREAAGIPGTYFGLIVWIPRDATPNPEGVKPAEGAELQRPYGAPNHDLLDGRD